MNTPVVLTNTRKTDTPEPPSSEETEVHVSDVSINNQFIMIANNSFAEISPEMQSIDKDVWENLLKEHATDSIIQDSSQQRLQQESEESECENHSCEDEELIIKEA